MSPHLRISRRLHAAAILLLVLLLPVQSGVFGSRASAAPSSTCGPECCCLERSSPSPCCCCGDSETEPARGCDCGRVPLGEGDPAVPLLAPDARGDLRGIRAQLEEAAWTACHLPVGPPSPDPLECRARSGPGHGPPGASEHGSHRGPAGRRLLARGAPGLLAVLCVART